MGRTPVVASLLALTSLTSFWVGSAAPAVAEGDRTSPPPKAKPGDERAPAASLDAHHAEASLLETEGRAALERGDRAAGAELLAKAWAMRSRIFAEEARREAARRIDELRMRSATLEKEAHALRESGRVADAEARIQEAAGLWKQAEELVHREKARATKALAPAAKAVTDTARDADAAARRKAVELWAKAWSGKPDPMDRAPRKEKEDDRVPATDPASTDLRRKKVAALEAEAADLWAAGRLGPAEERWAQAATLRESLAGDLRRAARVKAAAKPAAPAKDHADRTDALDARIERLSRQVDALTKAVQALLESQRAARAETPTPAK